MRNCNRKTEKWMTVIGSFLITLPIGIAYGWGHVGVYALSYIVVRGETKRGVDTPWVASVSFLFDCCGIFLSGVVNKKPRTRRFVLFLAVFMYAGGLFLTYLTVKISVAALTMSVGVLCGLSGGVINGMALQYAGEWASEDLGFIIGFVQSGAQLWPILVNPLFNIFVNPDNLSPSIEVNSMRLFSQPAILDKVPSAFIGLGASSFLLEFVGALCMKDFTYLNPEEIQLTDNTIDHPELVIKDRNDSFPKEIDKSLRQIMISLSFYSLSAVHMMFECSMLVLVNYYKEYGAVWINDDYFLANLGILFVAFGAIGYPLSGFVSDHIGVKKTLVCLLSMSSWLSMLMFFTPMLSRWLYLFNILLLGFFLSPIFSCSAVSVRLLFGKANYMRNFFLVTVLSMVTDLLIPLGLQVLLTLGWFYVILVSAAMCAVALVIVVLAFPVI